MRIGGVLLAAGGGSRFRAAGGGQKQLATFAGRPLVEAPLRVLAASALDDRVVVLGDGFQAVLDAIELHGARPVENPSWRDGLASSLRAGVLALERCDAAVIALGDGPRLSAAAIERVAAALRAGEPYVRAVYAGERHGHPVGLAATLWDALPAHGEAGGRALGVPAVPVDCSDLPAPGDVDTPDALD